MNRYFLLEKVNRVPLLEDIKALKRTAHAAQVSEATVKRVCSKSNKTYDTVEAPEKPVFTSPPKNANRQ